MIEEAIAYCEAQVELYRKFPLHAQNVIRMYVGMIETLQRYLPR